MKAGLCTIGVGPCTTGDFIRRSLPLDEDGRSNAPEKAARKYDFATGLQWRACPTASPPIRTHGAHRTEL